VGFARKGDWKTMQRRKFIAGMGSLAAAGAAGIGTGAFTSVEADRTVNVEVADDASAYLALEKSDGPNAAYASTSGDELSINVTDAASNEGATGLNDNALTIVRDIFKITNQGTQDVFVWIEGFGNEPIGVFSDAVASGSTVGNPDTGMGPNNPGATPQLPPVNIPEDHRVDVGNTQDEIGLSFNTRDGNTISSSITMTVVAKAVSEYPDGSTVTPNP
jgi:hypothetical protein